MKENVDYELVPCDGDLWHVRLKTGMHIEHVIQYRNLAVADESVQFNFDVIYSPSGIDEDDTDLQETASVVLYSILESLEAEAKK